MLLATHFHSPPHLLCPLPCLACPGPCVLCIQVIIPTFLSLFLNFIVPTWDTPHHHLPCISPYTTLPSSYLPVHCGSVVQTHSLPCLCLPPVFLCPLTLCLNMPAWDVLPFPTLPPLLDLPAIPIAFVLVLPVCAFPPFSGYVVDLILLPSATCHGPHAFCLPVFLPACLLCLPCPHLPALPGPRFLTPCLFPKLHSMSFCIVLFIPWIVLLPILPTVPRLYVYLLPCLPGMLPLFLFSPPLNYFPFHAIYVSDWFTYVAYNLPTTLLETGFFYYCLPCLYALILPALLGGWLGGRM